MFNEIAFVIQHANTCAMDASVPACATNVRIKESLHSKFPPLTKRRQCRNIYGPAVRNHLDVSIDIVTLERVNLE